MNNFPSLPPVPGLPPTLTSLSNYSLSRNRAGQLSQQNYYHLGPRNNYSLMESPYNTTLSVPIHQSLQQGYNNARVSSVIDPVHVILKWEKCVVALHRRGRPAEFCGPAVSEAHLLRSVGRQLQCCLTTYSGLERLFHSTKAAGSPSAPFEGDIIVKVPE